MKLCFVITNDKASYVAKEDNVFLFSVAKETVLNNFLSMEFWRSLDYLFTLNPTLASLVFRAIGLDTINNIQGRLCRLPLNSVLANLTYSFFYNKSPARLTIRISQGL